MEVRALGVTPLLGNPVWTWVIRVLNGEQGQGVVSRLYQGDHPTVTAIFSIIVLNMLHTYWFKSTNMLLVQRKKKEGACYSIITSGKDTFRMHVSRPCNS